MIDIKNFILFYYNKSYVNIEHKRYFSQTPLMFKCIKNQIKFFYPNSYIHVLTNCKLEEERMVVYHFNNNLSGLNDKLETYGLLNEAAMYVDLDIILTRPFSQEHLQTSHSFNLYREYTEENCKQLTPSQKKYTHYNSGVVWIPEPSQKLKNELVEISKSINSYRENDEYAVSYYVHDKKWQMRTNDQVNVIRNDFKNITNAQSIHYTGRERELYLNDYKSKLFLF